MKKILFPTLFLAALSSAAFTNSSHTTKSYSEIAYYYDATGMCQPWEVDDYNCVADDMGYLCTENIPGLGWEVMCQDEFGSTCYQPYYSYYSND